MTNTTPTMTAVTNIARNSLSVTVASTLHQKFLFRVFFYIIINTVIKFSLVDIIRRSTINTYSIKMFHFNWT